LGSINLSEFVSKPFTNDAEFNYEDFKNAVAIAVEALDEIVDENLQNHALTEQREMSYNYRNVGLGICGLYDCFVKLGITYGSEDSVNLANRIMYLMFRAAVITSNALAAQKGSFPKYSDEVWNSRIIANHFTRSEVLKMKEYGLRNCSLLSIAPAGSIATLLNISTGCEPAYSLSYTRKTESLNGEDKYYDVNIGIVEEYRKVHTDGKLPEYFVTAKTIDWRDRILLQSALQYNVDTAISSTINLKKDITVDEIEQLYLFAWEKKLKGVTIFREGCYRTGVLTAEKEDKKESAVKELPVVKPIDTPPNMVGKKMKITTGCGSTHVHCYFDRDTGRFLELWIDEGSENGCYSYMKGLSRMTSLCARNGADVSDIVDQLKSVKTCPSYAVRRAVKKDTSKGSSCPVAIANAIIKLQEEMDNEVERGMYWETYYDDEQEKPLPDIPSEMVAELKDDNYEVVCPECGSKQVIPENGCWSCKSCGYTKCG